MEQSYNYSDADIEMKYDLKKSNLLSSGKPIAGIITISFFTVLVCICYMNPVTKTRLAASDHVPATFVDGQGTSEKDSNSNTRQMISPEIICVEKGIVGRGDTPSTILEGHLPLKSIYDLSEKSKQTYPLTKIRRSHLYKIFNRNNSFFSFEYEINSDEKLVIVENGNAYSIRREPIPFTVEIKRVDGTITTSLFTAIEKTGESHKLGFKLAEIFAWDIDFSRDICPGDSFSIIVEKRYREGKEYGYGNIIAASFSNRGIKHNAFLFKNSNNNTAYYDENGNSLKKSFLKAPLTFSRISSGYSTNRLHPILHIMRPHKAIDYAAPKGTPIKTVGDGIITVKTRTRSAGNYIKIRHKNGYETVYNHMNRFAKGMKKGNSVVQGEVIGYVGSTGLATGPHLDFRMKKNGKYINPLTIKPSAAEPVSPLKMALFKKAISPLISRLHVKAIEKTASRTNKPLPEA